MDPEGCRLLTGNQIVAYYGAMVARDDKVFKALADGSRRQLLDRLRHKGGLTLGALCEGHEMSRQAVTKHLALLEEANLVVTVKRGREKLHYLNPVPIGEIYARWIGKFEKGRLEALDNLKRALQEMDHE
jgi:DNA-binding transcriptional ArsR family regulator